jgi:hypothetical protein
MLLLTKILLTILTLGYSAIPAKFDSDNTHATNPLWTGHARFHVVWQVTSYCIIAAFVLACIWLPIFQDHTGLVLATVAATAAYAGFFTALLTMKLYGGTAFDINGVQPIHPFGIELDLNVALFLPLAVLTVVCIWLVYRVIATG